MAEQWPRLDHKWWVGGQYKTPHNLNARIQLHKRFSTNQYAWSAWVFDHLQLVPGMSVLEVGGGPGGLWQENRSRMPDQVQVDFTDQSPGMVAQAQATLGDLPAMRFSLADVQALPFVDDTFDVVIANHMLYHVTDHDLALREMRRVLRPTGRLLVATNDRAHMQELRALAGEFMAGASQLIADNKRFPFDVATNALSAHFGQVQLHRYHNSLVITDAEALADYMLSGVAFMKLPAIAEAPFRKWLRGRIAARGPVTATAAVGLFEATTLQY